MSFCLKQLCEYSDIVIQCHDNPDADALACGFALKWYLAQSGIKARFVYGGNFAVSKSNLVLMTERLGIKAEHITELHVPELLVTVDCQYGESNVTAFEAKNIITIDHHRVTGKAPDICDIRSNYGSCATILYELFKDAGIDINTDKKLATALYYGLMTDTNSFAEISHPADKDLRDYAKFDPADIILFRNSNLTRNELDIAGDALKSAVYNDVYSYSIVEARPCDPNILGIISDMLLEVDSIKTCLVYSIHPYGIKISVRSCVKEVMASELAGYLAEGMGGGGGHIVKAGGLLKRELLTANGIEYDKDRLREYMSDRMKRYFMESEIIIAGRHFEDISLLKHYVKKNVTVGYVYTSEIAPPGTRIVIRTLEGDVETVIKKDFYIILGVEGEIYPCSKEKFENSYKPIPDKYIYPAEYAPAVIEADTGQRIELLPLAKSCVAEGGAGIYVRRLDHRVKVFTSWDPEKYYLGVKGDYLATRADDPSDVYIIAQNIFEKTYDPA